MNCYQRVDSRDLEDPQDSRIGSHHAQASLVVPELTSGCEKRAHARGVEKRALGKINDDGVGGRRELCERILELRRRREVELTRHARYRGTTRQQFAAHVKIVSRGHGERV